LKSVKGYKNNKNNNSPRSEQNRDGLEMKRGTTKRLSSGRNSSSATVGGKTAGETRTSTGGDRGGKGETDGKQNNTRGPKTGLGTVLLKENMQQVVETHCSSLAMDWMSTLCSGPGFSS